MKTSRIEALSDALFAIVMTLLILEIKIPEIANSANWRELLNSLITIYPKFISFFISFIVVGIFWIGHHNQFNFIKKSDRVFLWLNILFFMFISFIPFSAALLGEYHENEVAIIFYGINLAIVGLLLFIHWNYAVSKELTAKLDKNFIKGVNKRILVGPLFYFLGILLSLVNKNLGIIFFIIPVIIQILPGRIDKTLLHSLESLAE